MAALSGSLTSAETTTKAAARRTFLFHVVYARVIRAVALVKGVILCESRTEQDRPVSACHLPHRWGLLCALAGRTDRESSLTLQLLSSCTEAKFSNGSKREGEIREEGQRCPPRRCRQPARFVGCSGEEWESFFGAVLSSFSLSSPCSGSMQTLVAFPSPRGSKFCRSLSHVAAQQLSDAPGSSRGSPGLWGGCDSTVPSPRRCDHGTQSDSTGPCLEDKDGLSICNWRC